MKRNDEGAEVTKGKKERERELEGGKVGTCMLGVEQCCFLRVGRTAHCVSLCGRVCGVCCVVREDDRFNARWVGMVRFGQPTNCAYLWR